MSRRPTIGFTKKQKQLLEFLEHYQMQYGASPTIREMCKAMKVHSDNSIVKHLNGLQKKGYISRRADIPRGVGLFDSVRERLHNPPVKLPLLGSIPAGGPVSAEENIERHYMLGDDVVYKPQDSFLLRVKGDSMVDVGIYEGDLVIACRSIDARDRDVVVALVDGMNTVKTLRKTPEGKFYLQPENQNYKPIYPEGSLQTQGVVTGLIRMYRQR